MNIQRRDNCYVNSNTEQGVLLTLLFSTSAVVQPKSAFDETAPDYMCTLHAVWSARFSFTRACQVRTGSHVVCVYSGAKRAEIFSDTE